jgi:hypothetical protein
MRNLTTRATNYLKTLLRDPDAVTDRTDLENFFIGQDIPLFEPVIDFGVRYSGFTLQTKAKKRDAFSALLVSSQDIAANKPYDFEREGESYLFYCGNHETAQFYFYINQLGQFCSDGYKGANVLSSSFELEVEQYAYRNELSDWLESPFYELGQTIKLEKTLKAEFEILAECSDEYNSWFASDNIVIQKGVWLHEPSYYLHFFGKTNDAINNIVSHFQNAGIIRVTR